MIDALLSRLAPCVTLVILITLEYVGVMVAASFVTSVWVGVAMYVCASVSYLSSVMCGLLSALMDPGARDLGFLFVLDF